jgi:Uma2 family endonuclease
MSVLITDPDFAAEVRKVRADTDADRYTEVWDGVIVMPALPNTEHQNLVMRLGAAFAAVVDWDAGDSAQPGANVSDREGGWKENYRCPDVVVALAGGRAKDCGTHWCGGPDLVVEIESPGQDARDKLAFYAAVGCREVLLIDRDPWALKLCRLDGGTFTRVGRVENIADAELKSEVLGLTFTFAAGKTRPAITIAHPATGRTWTA